MLARCAETAASIHIFTFAWHIKRGCWPVILQALFIASIPTCIFSRELHHYHYHGHILREIHKSSHQSPFQWDPKRIQHCKVQILHGFGENEEINVLCQNVLSLRLKKQSQRSYFLQDYNTHVKAAMSLPSELSKHSISL